MDIVCVSDTHGLHYQIPFGDVPFGDVLIHAGDCTNVGRPAELENFVDWFCAFPHPYKILIAGNHDFCFSRDADYSQRLVESAGITYLQDSCVEVLGVKFYGSPMTPEFYHWAFMYSVDDAEPIWDKIPEDTDVLITHGPPYGVLDSTFYGKMAVGCRTLAKRIKGLPKLRCHVFGHIHEEYGSVEVAGIKYINASICNVRYKPINAPVLVKFI